MHLYEARSGAGAWHLMVGVEPRRPGGGRDAEPADADPGLRPTVDDLLSAVRPLLRADEYADLQVLTGKPLAVARAVGLAVHPPPPDDA